MSAGRRRRERQQRAPGPARPGRRVTVEDVRELVGPATPHFALQIRDRDRAPDRGARQPTTRPASRASARSRRLEELAERGVTSRDRSRRASSRFRASRSAQGQRAADGRASARGQRRAPQRDAARAAARATRSCASGPHRARLHRPARARARVDRPGPGPDALRRRQPASTSAGGGPGLARMVKGVFGPTMADEHRIARLLLALSPGDGVLDVACGPGNFSRSSRAPSATPGSWSASTLRSR